MSSGSAQSDIGRRPARRRLRVYAFDPSASVTLDTAVLNDATIELPWETPWQDPVTIGPVNDYLEVIDFDPACGLFYAPVDLNDPLLLAQDGLTPAEGKPQFHQQMVFASAMRTIHTFERALGRAVLWAGPPGGGKDGKAPHYLKRLRIYPHALREANAYYSPDKTALLFGYFKPDADPAKPDAQWVFTCLSQDIIAHETTHAILHGLQPRTIDASNPDMLAFHEGFADIVALLQHFTVTEVIAHQLSRSGGSLRVNNLLTGLAAQFGKATGRGSALRFALKLIEDEAAAAVAAQQPGGKMAPAIERLSDTLEPHERGQFLVAAVFDAFVTIYERRTADLFRLAGVRAGSTDAMPSELVARLAGEAAQTAEQVLRMCVRGLDYLPPVDNSFGEYLRAIITADADLVPSDPMRCRVAFAEAFRKRGIPVPGCISYAPDSLMWEEPDTAGRSVLSSDDAASGLFATVLGKLELGVNFARRARERGAGSRSAAFGDDNLRRESIRIVTANQLTIWKWLEEPSVDAAGQKGSEIDAAWEGLLGIRMTHADIGGLALSKTLSTPDKLVPALSVNSARIARRAGPDGQELHQLIVQVTQRRRGYVDPDVQKRCDAAPAGALDAPGEDFWFRGGATLIVDLRDGRLRRVIRKRIDDEKRLDRHRRFLLGDPLSMAIAASGPAEPFAMVHRL